MQKEKRKKIINPAFTKINKVTYAKFELNRMNFLETIVFTHMHTRIHICITVNVAQMNSGYHKKNKYVKFSESNFFHDYNTFLSTCSKSKKG